MIKKQLEILTSQYTALLTLELHIKKTVGNKRFAPCFQRFFCTLILGSSLNSILLHSETESKSCSV